MTSTAPFLLTVPFFSFKHMSNFYRLINFILDNINILSHVHASLYPTFMVRPSVSWSVIGWSLLSFSLFSPQHSYQNVPIIFFHCHYTYAHDHCKLISCLVLFFIPSPLTILLHFFLKQTDTFIVKLTSQTRI